MEFTVLDVGHGACAYLKADSAPQNLMLFDCGHKSDPEIRPSTYLPSIGQQSVEILFVSNYDEDHISDLPRLRDGLAVHSLHRNKSISADQLRAVKLQQSGEISPAMESMLDMIDSYTGGPPNPAPEFPGASYDIYHNDHPFGDGNDTNNISLVTFLTVNDTTILLPGDVERDGWLALIENQYFAQRLASVDIFVASHHGRRNGYCNEVFTEHGCRPAVFVFSDSNIIHATQETTALYRQWASGVQHNGQTRHVLTTRNDGPVSWNL